MKNLLFLFLMVAIGSVGASFFLTVRFEPGWSIASADEQPPLFSSLPFDQGNEYTVATSTDIDLSQSDISPSVGSDPTPRAGEIAVRVPVLMYHHIRPMEPRFSTKDRLFSVTPAHFEKQMIELMRNGYHPITPDQLETALAKGQQTLPSKPVLITFDDGLRDQYTYAFPILKKYNLKATFFIISEADRYPFYMTDDMIKEIDKSGLVTIASHTKHHVFLARYRADVRKEELEGSKRELEQLVGHSVATFAYPYGSWSPGIEQEVKNAGYHLGFWVVAGSLHTDSSRYLLRRITVVDGTNMATLLKKYSSVALKK